MSHALEILGLVLLVAIIAARLFVDYARTVNTDRRYGESLATSVAAHVATRRQRIHGDQRWWKRSISPGRKEISNEVRPCIADPVGFGSV